MLHVSSFLYSALSSTDSPLGPGVQLDKTRSLLQGVPSSGGRVRKSGTYERVRVSLEEELEAAEVSSVSSEPGTLPFLTGGPVHSRRHCCQRHSYLFHFISPSQQKTIYRRKLCPVAPFSLKSLSIFINHMSKSPTFFYSLQLSELPDIFCHSKP